MKLTAKQEKFAQLVAEGISISDAYRQVYDVSNMKAETVHREAFELSNHHKISARLAEIRKPIIERTQITLDSHLRDLMMLRNMAVKKKQISAAIAAEVARGKAAGIHVEKSEIKHELPEVVVKYID